MKFKLTFLLLLLPFTFLTAQINDSTFADAEPEIFKKGEPMVGLNFVSNVPGLPFGISIPAFIRNSRIGIYLDFKASLSDNGVQGNNLTDSLTKNDVDNFLKHPYLGTRETTPILFNAGITIRTKNRRLFCYTALGVRIKETYHQYFDPTRTWSSVGHYHILESRQNQLNLTAGGIYIFESGLILQGGFDTTPWGLNLGIGFVFSRHHH